MPRYASCEVVTPSMQLLAGKLELYTELMDTDTAAIS
jgi:hypothetical protein